MDHLTRLVLAAFLSASMPLVGTQFVHAKKGKEDARNESEPSGLGRDLDNRERHRGERENRDDRGHGGDRGLDNSTSGPTDQPGNQEDNGGSDNSLAQASGNDEVDAIGTDQTDRF